MLTLKETKEFELSVSKTKIKNMMLNSEYTWNCFMNPAFSDVILVVEDKEFPALRFFLAMHSTYFEARFNGNFHVEKNEKITLEDVKINPFEILLRFMYSGNLVLHSVELNDVMDLLSLAHYFGIHTAVQCIADYMEELPRTEENVVESFNKAAIFDLKKLQKILLKYIINNTKTFLETDVFMTFNEFALSILLDSCDWTVKESLILRRVSEWLFFNTTTTKQEELLSKIKLHLIDNVELIKGVRATKLFDDEQIFAALLERSENVIKNNYRGVKKTILSKKFIQMFTLGGNKLIYSFKFLIERQTIEHIEVMNRDQDSAAISLGIGNGNHPINKIIEFDSVVFHFQPITIDEFRITDNRITEIADISFY